MFILTVLFFLLCIFSVTAKEEEKQKLVKWSSELKLEREQLEQRVKQLSNSITVKYFTNTVTVRTPQEGLKCLMVASQ